MTRDRLATSLTPRAPMSVLDPLSPRSTLLLVDDDDDARAAARRALAPCFQIREASRASDALDLLAIGRVDGIVCDFAMPEMSGLELLQRVRLTYPHVLRIMMTGSRDIRIAARALNEGAAERYLLKPWDRLDLVTIIELALATRKGRRRDV